MDMSSFTSDLALSYSSWFDLFHVQAALTDVSLQSGSHTSVAIVEIFHGWFIVPWNDYSSLFILGGGKFVNALTFVGSGLTLCLEITSPKNGIHICLNRHSLYLV